MGTLTRHARRLRAAASLRVTRVLGLALTRRWARRAVPLLRNGIEKKRALESITGSPCFDAAYYVRKTPLVGAARISPLIHYVLRGAQQRLDPSPLFDTAYYLQTNADLATADINPLAHYLTYGAREGRDPHPLFDTSYYLEVNRDVAVAGVNPLAHYLTYGAREGRDPHPLFDTSYYLESNPDVARAGANPLVHFAEWGAAEGRNPHPTFDTQLYLEHYPNVAASGANALVDYLSRPKPRTVSVPKSAAAPAILRSAGRFWVETAGFRGSSARLHPGRRTILCFTHVPPYPPRAGNEYGEYRQLDYLERHGYRVVLAVSPLPGDELSSERFRPLCERFPHTILCSRDGLVQYGFDEDQLNVKGLDGRQLRPLGAENGEDLVTGEQERRLVNLERLFCHDFLARLALHLEAELAPCIVLSQYIFQTRFLPLIRSKSLKVIQTHDMFSTKQRKVVQFGVQDALNLTAEQERKLLLRADLILSCQQAEAREFAALVPERHVLEIPFDFDVVDRMPPPRGAKVLYVASDNALNTKGLRDFLCLAWPCILREVPDAELVVAGKVCRAIGQAPENVRLLGLVDDLDPLYEQARLTINPSVAGTGFKIKTAESLSRLRPVVSWPSGVDGFQAELAAMCYTAQDWPDFAAQVIGILRSPWDHGFSAEQQERIRHWLAPDTIYGPLLKHLDGYCEDLQLRPYERAEAAEAGDRCS